MLNNEKDYITINTNNGEVLQAELVAKFNIDNLGDYVLYKVNNTIYGAKYEIVNNNTQLITDLSDYEKQAINDVAKSLEVE